MGFAPLAPAESRLVDPLGAPARAYKQHAPGTHYFGCGERTGGLEKTGSHQVFWNIDRPGGHTAGLNNLYTSIPFYVGRCRTARRWGCIPSWTAATAPGVDLASSEDPARCGFGGWR